MKDFTVKKAGRYYNLIFIGYKAPNSYIDIHFWNNVFLSKKQDVKIFIEKFNDIRNQLIKLCDSIYLSNKIMRINFDKIDGFASGLDIRSGWSDAKIAETFFTWYNVGKAKAEESWAEFFKSIEGKEKLNYYQNYRHYETLDSWNKRYELGYLDYKPIYDLEVFSDPLDNALELTKEILNRLK